MSFVPGFYRTSTALLAGLTLATAPAIAQTTESNTPITQPAAEAAPPAIGPQHPANILPADSAGIFVVDTKPESWIALTKFGLFPHDFSAPSLIFEFIAPGSRFSTDIQPWIGDQFAFGYMGNGDLVTITPVKAPELIPNFLKTVQQRKQDPATVENYQGVEIIHWPPQEFKLNTTPKKPQKPLPEDAPKPKPIIIPGWTIAYLPEGYVISSAKPETIKQIIDQRNQPSFSTTKEFQALLQHPQYNRALVIGGGNYEKFIPLLTQPPATGLKTPTSLPFPGLPNLPFNPAELTKSFAAIAKQYDTFSAAMWATPQGLRVNSSVTLREPRPQAPTAAEKPAQILKQIPANSYGFMNTPDGVQGLAKSLNLDTGAPTEDGESTVLNPAIQMFVGPVSQLLQGFLGVESGELISWMDGEMALFAFPSKQSLLAKQFKVDMGLGAVIQTSDRARAETTLNKILRNLQENYPQSLTSQKQTVNNKEVVSLNTIDNDKKTTRPIMSYSWIKPDTVLIQAGIDPQLIPQPWQTLPQSPNFQDAIKALPANDQGYFYLNGSSSSAFLFNSVIPNLAGKRFAQSRFINEMRGIVGSVRSMAGTTISDEQRITSEGVMMLNRSAQPPLTTADDWIKAAEQKLTGRQPSWAIANYSQALRLAPNNTDILIARGKARYQGGDAMGSIRDFDRALSFLPTISAKRNAVYQRRAESYLAAFQYEAAIEDLSRTIQNRLNLAESYRERANAYLALGQYQAAFDDATQAIQLKPSQESYTSRCYARARLGDFAAAQADCDQAKTAQSVKADSKRKYVLRPRSRWSNPKLDLKSTRCYVKAGLGETDAIELCNQVLKSYRNNPTYQENKGLAHALLQQPKDAKAALEKAQTLFQKYGNQTGSDRVRQVLEQFQSLAFPRTR